MKPQEMVTLGIAVAGFLLSVRNAWRDHRRDKVRLRVIPKVSFPIGSMPHTQPCFAFEIINDGVFPVTVDDVGFLFTDSKRRGALSTPVVLDGGAWPRRLEPHASVTVYSAGADALGFDFRRVKCAYVAAASGRVFTGHSKALKVVVAQGAIPAPRFKPSRGGMPGMLTVSDFDE
ncbi:hypothetical protein [Roseisolibacter agri]|uniref:Uncharacterized protein n=1 Tax=Roseisolibacter agri TaxID=2014610 RepID=A0AA37Q982_9BACT|nr:hypothetical protein [Roseisolibacter agri]GLC24621.1 hypothetical protein rosag_11340 [Roseisolibacter agri]